MTTYGESFNAAVAGELRAERGRKQITIAAIVEATGLSKSAVLNYLNGKRDIPLPAFLDLCRALGVETGAIADAAAKSLEQD